MSEINENIIKYELNPTLCKFCNNKLPYQLRKNKFCNSSHAASYNNKVFIKRKKTRILPDKYCEQCNTKLTFIGNHFDKKYCNLICYNKHKNSQQIHRQIDGKELGMKGKMSTSTRIKRYLIEKYGNKCMECGQDKVNKFTGNVPIELHHKDGDFTNNAESNLKLLCPCCHSLTETYRAGNKNSTRVYRYNQKI